MKKHLNKGMNKTNVYEFGNLCDYANNSKVIGTKSIQNCQKKGSFKVFLFLRFILVLGIWLKDYSIQMSAIKY